LPFLLGENAEVEYPLLSQVLEIGGENAWKIELKV
jgi:hypothetical protein